MNFTKLLFQKHTLSFVGLNTVFLVLLSLSACSSKVRSNVVTYGLNSCFKLNTGELVVNSDKYAEKFYKDHCEINGLPLAMNRVIRSSDTEYVFICIATETTHSDIPTVFGKDTSLHQLEISKGNQRIGNITDYHSVIATRSGFWLYYFIYNNEQLKRPFVMIFCSKNKAYINNYYSSASQIKTRLDCEEN